MRNGNPSGPFTLPQLEQMRVSGQAGAKDIVRYRGTEKALDQFLQWARHSPEAVHLRQSRSPVPELPPESPEAAETPIPANLMIDGAEGMTIDALAREIAQGGRLVTYPYCISILIMTFKRNSKVTLVPAGQDNFGHTLGYTLISLLFGWWGFPAGPVFTLLSLFYAARGGKDITREVMGSLLNPRQMQETFTRRKKPYVGILARLFPYALLLLLLTPIVFIIALMGSSSSGERHVASNSPGAAQFASANSLLDRTGQTGLGNTPEATELAGKMSSMLQALRDEYYTGTKSDDFQTYCRLGGDKCVFLVEVPGLNKYSGQAKEEIAGAAWTTGEALLAQLPENRRPKELAIATRGRILYDVAWSGPVAENGRPNSKQSGIWAKDLLYPFFAAN